MKKLIITITLLIMLTILFKVFSNPNPVVPHFINEFMFDTAGWKLELHSFYPAGQISLDGAYLSSSTDTSFFNNGIIINLEGYTAITQNDLQTYLNINPVSDTVKIYFD